MRRHCVIELVCPGRGPRSGSGSVSKHSVKVTGSKSVREGTVKSLGSEIVHDGVGPESETSVMEVMCAWRLVWKKAEAVAEE